MVTLIHPRPGDWLKNAYWYNADKPGDREEAEDKITAAILELAINHSVTTKPIQWEHVDPMDPQVPDPPKNMRGNIKCAIGSAEVIGQVYNGPRFSEEISPWERQMLRQATRKEYRRAGGIELTDEEADAIIDEFGPEVAAKRPN